MLIIKKIKAHRDDIDYRRWINNNNEQRSVWSLNLGKRQFGIKISGKSMLQLPNLTFTYSFAKKLKSCYQRVQSSPVVKV
jgi:hypothetical protein